MVTSRSDRAIARFTEWVNSIDITCVGCRFGERTFGNTRWTDLEPGHMTDRVSQASQTRDVA